MFPKLCAGEGCETLFEKLLAWYLKCCEHLYKYHDEEKLMILLLNVGPVSLMGHAQKKQGKKKVREVTENAAFVSDSHGRLSCFESKARQHGFSSHFMTWQNITLLKNLFLLCSFTPGSHPGEKRVEFFWQTKPGSQETESKNGKKVGKGSKEMILCATPSNCMALSGFSVLQ